jgi:hypothetical protein
MMLSSKSCLALAVLVLGTAVAGAAGQPVWELRPYRVQILLGFAARPELGGELPSVLAERLAASISSLQGGAWNVAVAPAAPVLQQAMSASLTGITAEALPKEALEADKVMLVEVSAAGGGYQVTACELDVATGLWSAPVVQPLAQLLKLPDACSAAVFRAFAPLARLSVLKDRQVVLRMRAMALKPRDAALATVRPGSVFRLAARAVDETGSAARAAPIPWTFCTIEEVAQDELHGRLVTALREPLPERWETSLEVLALGVVPPRRASVLTLTTTARGASQGLPGYEVYTASPGAGSPIFLGRTDRQGSLAIQPSDHILQILLVKHGDQWLARLPIVPGLELQLSAAVDHNEHRIALEGRVATLRDAIVDLAARRQILLKRARARISAHQFAEAEQVLKQLRELPSAEDLVTARIADAKKDFSGDEASLTRLDAVLAGFQQTLAARFNAKEIDDLAAEIPQPNNDAKPPSGEKK